LVPESLDGNLRPASGNTPNRSIRLASRLPLGPP